MYHILIQSEIFHNIFRQCPARIIKKSLFTFYTASARLFTPDFRFTLYENQQSICFNHFSTDNKLLFTRHYPLLAREETSKIKKVKLN